MSTELADFGLAAAGVAVAGLAVALLVTGPRACPVAVQGAPSARESAPERLPAARMPVSRGPGAQGEP